MYDKVSSLNNIFFTEKTDFEKLTNEMTLIFKNDSKNESLARVAVTAFISQLDPTINCINDIKTSVSEAVTNAIIHGYEKDKNGDITIYCRYVDNKFYIEVKDNGVGIFDVNLAKTPLFTSKPEMDRSGLGFTLMETFMDTVEVESVLGSGTIVRMTKTI